MSARYIRIKSNFLITRRKRLIKGHIMKIILAMIFTVLASQVRTDAIYPAVWVGIMILIGIVAVGLLSYRALTDVRLQQLTMQLGILDRDSVLQFFYEGPKEVPRKPRSKAS